MGTNLLQALFSCRPREDRTPKEDFLTEAFACLLAKESDLCSRWIAELTDGRIQPDMLAAEPSVTTQEVHRFEGDEAKSRRIDMVVQFATKTSGDHLWFAEHKWDSPASVDQLETYRQILQQMPNDISTGLCFICANVAQQAEARSHCEKAFLWEDIHRFLLSEKTRSPQASELAEFLGLQGLGIQEPLSIGSLAAYGFGQSVPGAMIRLAGLLAEASYEWDVLPKRFRLNRTVTSKIQWGRIGVSFSPSEEKRWEPNLFAGFLLDGENHGFELCDLKQGPDLVFLIECEPGISIRGTALQEKAEKAVEAFPQAVVRKPNDLGKNWRKTVIREPLAKVIRSESTPDKQCEAIYKRLGAYCRVLFDGGELETSLRQTWPC